MYRFVPGEAPASAAELEARYRRTWNGPQAQGERWYNWAVAPRGEPARAFGTVELSLLGGGTRALLAYSLGREAQGRGYATEACRAALAYLRDGTPVRLVEAFVDTRNARSIALLERLGFARTATIYGADAFKGTTSDEYQYSLTLVKDDYGEVEPR